MEKILDLDRNLTLALNGLHSPFFDNIMIFASKVWVWLPLYIAVFIWFFCTRKWRVALVCVGALLLGVLITDRLSFHIKEAIERLRPFVDPVIADSVRLLEKPGSHLFGFPSGHACNTFCAALLSSLIAGRKWWAPVAFSWATLVSYSRIYVGKHFLGDVLAGALLGLAIGGLLFLMIRKWLLRYSNPE